MKYLKLYVLTALLSLANVAFAQTELLSKVPTTKEEFKQSEKHFLATMQWLESTPIKKDEVKHKEQFTLLMAWLSNSPTVTLNVFADMIQFDKQNSELLLFHLGGWGRYSIQNNYSKDVVQGNLAGFRSCFKVYKAGGLKKDKFLEKLMKLDEKGKLEDWIRTELKESK